MIVRIDHKTAEHKPAAYNIHSFLGMDAVVESAPMRDLMATVERVARTTVAVLITGESGTGKELIARAIHHLSPRAAKPWVDLSCAALPDNLVESELFGYEKGAFSGADSAKPGLFEMAHSGTIFLDEIGELDARMQVKLLRVLDAVPYYRLGGVRKINVDVRVVTATNVDLERAVADGRFRNDLFHRLSQFVLRVPPLRERVDDIIPLARYFLAQYDPAMRLSPAAAAWLKAQRWPGNIRELRNTITKAAVLTRGQELQLEDLPRAAETGYAAAGATDGSGSALDEMERRAIFEALAATNGHQSKAAERLGISRRTLSRKLRAYQLESRLNESRQSDSRASRDMSVSFEADIEPLEAAAL